MKPELPMKKGNERNLWGAVVLNFVERQQGNEAMSQWGVSQASLPRHLVTRSE